MSNVDLCSTGGNAFVSAVSVQLSFVDNFSCIHCPVGTDRRWWPVKQFLRQGEDTTNCHSTMLADTDATVGHRSIPRVQNIQETSRKDDTHTQKWESMEKGGEKRAGNGERERDICWPRMLPILMGVLLCHLQRKVC